MIILLLVLFLPVPGVGGSLLEVILRPVQAAVLGLIVPIIQSVSSLVVPA